MKNECHRMLSFTRKQTVCARVWYRYLHRFGRFVANMTCSHVLHDGAVGPGGESGARVIVVQRRKVGLGAMCPTKTDLFESNSTGTHGVLASILQIDGTNNGVIQKSVSKKIDFFLFEVMYISDNARNPIASQPHCQPPQSASLCYLGIPLLEAYG